MLTVSIKFNTEKDSYFQVEDTLKFEVSIEDEDPEGKQNLVQTQPVTIIVLDENDNAPVFKNVSSIVKHKSYQVLNRVLIKTPLCYLEKNMQTFFRVHTR